jgi:hypothetical protein
MTQNKSVEAQNVAETATKKVEENAAGSTAKATPKSSVEEQLQAIALQEAQLRIELLKADLEAKAMEKREREYSIRDLRGRLADRDLQEKQTLEDRAQQGRTFTQLDNIDRTNWKMCSHRKGGKVTPRDFTVLTRGGDKEIYSVIKHMMINSDIWVHCTRCKKTWSPPVESKFFFDENGREVAPADGTFDQKKFEQAQIEYQQALAFPSNNTMSASVICQFKQFDPKTRRLFDANDKYRENISSTNLR